jgi:hypothetical protein
MKKADASNFAKSVLFSMLDDLEFKVAEHWMLDELSEEDREQVKEQIFRLLESLKRKNTKAS